MIERTISKKIKLLEKDFKVILLTGARQTGKTTLLRSISEQPREYVTLSNPRELDAAKDPDMFFARHPLPVMIDELQRVPQLFLKIKEIVDQRQDKNLVWLTGSQKPRLMKNVGDTLVGRVVEVSMLPLSQAEKQNDPYRKPYLPEFFADRPAPWTYKETVENIIQGGYPALQDMNRDNWDDWFSSYIETYLVGDIRGEFGNINSYDFIKFLRVLAARTGAELNYSAIAVETELTRNKVKDLISLLDSFGIIRIIPPYSSNKLKTLTKTPRLHFVDSGLCCYLLGIRSEEDFFNHNLRGAIFESYAVGELIKSSINNREMATFYFYREEPKARKGVGNGPAEIDLIKEVKGVLYPVEIKFTSSPTKNMAKHFARLEGLEHGTGTIVCMCDKRMMIAKDVAALPVSMI